MAEELAIAESVRAAARSCAAYLATTEPARAQIAAAHTQLVAAYSKDMEDADGEMPAEYGALDAIDPLPQETVGRELDMEAGGRGTPKHNRQCLSRVRCPPPQFNTSIIRS